jgi:hypothetical protein
VALQPQASFCSLILTSNGENWPSHSLGMLAITNAELVSASGLLFIQYPS